GRPVDGFPERPRLKRKNVKCIEDSDVAQVNRNSSSPEIRIEDHIEACKLRQSLERDLAVLSHVDVVDANDSRLELRLNVRIGAGCFAQLIDLNFGCELITRFRRENRVYLFQLLFGQGIRWIDLENASKFHLRSQIVLLLQRSTTGIEMLKCSVVTRLIIF